MIRRNIAKDLKAYYDKGYKTDITNIDIKGNEITFTKDGKKHTGKYEYNGKKTLKYPKGNRGVRFMFKLVDGNDKDFKSSNLAITTLHLKRQNTSISLWVMIMTRY